MIHQIDTKQCGTRGDAMAAAVSSCIHCGFCLPSCPTYELLGQETDSPRGRILLMKEVLEGRLAPEAAATHIDRCLGCLNCQTSCPSGVEYGHLLSSYRALPEAQQASAGNWLIRLRRWVIGSTLPYPKCFRLAVRLGQIARTLRLWTPLAFRPMLDLVPAEVPRAEPLQPLYPAVGEERARVMLHTGCAAEVLHPEITRAAIHVLTFNGVAVEIPTAQVCCGALAWHVGNESGAAPFARANVKVFGESPLPIITTAAGCGSGLKEYGLLLAGQPEQPRAEQLASRVTDVCQYLAGLTLKPFTQRLDLRVAYHDACHLAHAQGVRSAPRELLRRIPGVQLVEIAESEMCCGSAGTYNIDQPELAEQLGERKASRVAQTQCDVLALGNIGCQMQIEKHLQRSGQRISVMHTVQLLAQAYASPNPR